MDYSKLSYKKLLELGGFNYLGSSKCSTKLMKSYKHNCETYGIYLAPSTLAQDETHKGINTCPFSVMCKDVCLSKSGQNKINTIANHFDLSYIDKARIKKTHLFYDNRDLFMEILIREIRRAKNHAEKNGMQFAIRLNCTSDLNPTRFIYKGKKIFEIFPDVQFYDYTKVPSRLRVAEQYKNYFLVFSHDGSNWDVCEEWLKKGGNVAVVFDLHDEKGKQYLPTEWKGYKVKDCNHDDIRFMDDIKGGICGLTYHRTSNDYVKGYYNPVETPMVVRSL